MDEHNEQRSEEAAAPFEQWILGELFGHRRIAGRAREITIAGMKFLQVDVPNEDGSFRPPDIYSPKAFYRLQPTTEAFARQAAQAIYYTPIVAEHETQALPAAIEAERAEDYEF